MTQHEIREVSVWPRSDDRDKRSFDVGEGEFVLDTEYRGANRIVVAIASPVVSESDVSDSTAQSASEDADDEVNQCQWTLDSGEQCQRDATDGEYCWQHGAEE